VLFRSLDADGWRDEIVDVQANVPMRADGWLAIDSIGVVHLTYPVPGRMRRASQSRGGWEFDDAPPVTFIDASVHFSIATATDGTVHVGFAPAGADQDPTLVWQGRIDGEWTSEAVERGVLVQDVSLAVRPDGVPCMAYRLASEDHHPVRYACRCQPP
jgi:hypothetical protein